MYKRLLLHCVAFFGCFFLKASERYNPNSLSTFDPALLAKIASHMHPATPKSPLTCPKQRAVWEGELGPRFVNFLIEHKRVSLTAVHALAIPFDERGKKAASLSDLNALDRLSKTTLTSAEYDQIVTHIPSDMIKKMHRGKEVNVLVPHDKITPIVQDATFVAGTGVLIGTAVLLAGFISAPAILGFGIAGAFVGGTHKAFFLHERRHLSNAQVKSLYTKKVRTPHN